MNDFVSQLLSKLQHEISKKIFLLGNFNTDLLKYEISSSINNFINALSSNFMLPHMLLPKEYPKHLH